ncbi:hypothetical protein BDY24DRAFT_381680 [Mrakia frigida]|uniref:uncharacterized protein n=1 Tax=Mrakia frigida TaxID=29902 RepID=UPI003FCBEF2A
MKAGGGGNALHRGELVAVEGRVGSSSRTTRRVIDEVQEEREEEERSDFLLVHHLERTFRVDPPGMVCEGRRREESQREQEQGPGGRTGGSAEEEEEGARRIDPFRFLLGTHQHQYHLHQHPELRGRPYSLLYHHHHQLLQHQRFQHQQQQQQQQHLRTHPPRSASTPSSLQPSLSLPPPQDHLTLRSQLRLRPSTLSHPSSRSTSEAEAEGAVTSRRLRRSRINSLSPTSVSNLLLLRRWSTSLVFHHRRRRRGSQQQEQRVLRARARISSNKLLQPSPSNNQHLHLHHLLLPLPFPLLSSNPQSHQLLINLLKSLQLQLQQQQQQSLSNLNLNPSTRQQPTSLRNGPQLGRSSNDSLLVRMISRSRWIWRRRTARRRFRVDLQSRFRRRRVRRGGKREVRSSTRNETILVLIRNHLRRRLMGRRRRKGRRFR